MKLQVSVSAVVVKGKKFLLLKRAQFDEFGKKGTWTLPCGRIKIYENSNKAIIREVKEESNLKVKIIKPLGVWNKKKKNTWRTSICYLCKHVKGEVKLSKEHDDFLWLSFKEINKSKIKKWIKDYVKIAKKELGIGS